jgi:flagellar basal-body rod protein FlgC
MAFRDTFGSFEISSSGASAERLRMEVVANNIANAFSTRTPQGGPFRRQDVVFAAVLNDRLAGRRPVGPRAEALTAAEKEVRQLGGVQVVGIVDDPTELPRVYNPGHPDADARGFVTMPNVQLPLEMVNLISASRAYEANLRVTTGFRQAAEQAIALLRAQG